MGNVIDLFTRGEFLARSPDDLLQDPLENVVVDEQIVHTLETLLREARAGRLVGLAAAMVLPCGTTAHVVSGDWVSIPLAGCCGLIQQRILSEKLEEILDASDFFDNVEDTE
jgi:hypothetical protein